MVGLTVTVELLIIFMTVGQRPWFDRVVLRRLQVRQMDCMPWLSGLCIRVDCACLCDRSPVS